MKSRPLEERLLTMALCDIETRCWNFQGCISRSGYGMIRIGAKQKVTVAHRAAYEVFVGEIPGGMEMHHTCGNKRCIAPDHLRAVTRRFHLTELSPTNIAYKNARKTHCPKGHPLIEGNLIPSVLKRGGRNCLTCKRELCNAYQKKHRQDPAVVLRERAYSLDYQRRKKAARV